MWLIGSMQFSLMFILIIYSINNIVFNTYCHYSKQLLTYLLTYLLLFIDLCVSI